MINILMAAAITCYLLILSLIFLPNVFKKALRRAKKAVKKETAMQVLESTIKRHSDFPIDLIVAKKIKSSYQDAESVKKSLESLSEKLGLDFSEQEAAIDEVLASYVVIAEEYRETMAYQADRALVESELGRNKDRITEIVGSTGYTEQEFGMLERVKSENEAIYKIHEENLRKCDIIRPHNHKATPLRELSMNLVKVLSNMDASSDSWRLRAEVKRQLEELSEVIDEAIEELETYDSKRFIENELKISKHLMNELRKAQYVDKLSINKVKH